jgi:hypothetical protein
MTMFLDLLHDIFMSNAVLARERTDSQQGLSRIIAMELEL